MSGPLSGLPISAASPRIALLAGDLHPLAACEPFYAALDALRDAHGGDWRAFHTHVSDPRALPPASRRRLGEGTLVLEDPAAHAQDFARFGAIAPAALARVVADLAAFWGCAPAEVAARVDVRQALAFARAIQAFAPDMLVAVGQHHDSFRAAIVGRLLGVPRVAVLDDPDLGDPAANLMPLHLRGAAAVVATNALARAELLRRFADCVDAAAVVDGLAQAPVAIARAAGMGRAADAAPLGPAAAYGPLAPRQPRIPAVRPFVVMGAERTGSNLLVGMLDARPDFFCANELFNVREIAAGLVAWPEHAAADRRELAALRERGPEPLLDRLAADAARIGATHCGYKLIYGHALHDDHIVEATAGDGRCIVLHLLRRDRLQRWRSHLRALASDSWFGGAQDESAIVLPVAETAADFVAGEALEARFRAAFAGLPTVELDYEDLALRLPSAARRLGEAFGVDFGELVPRTHKTGPKDPRAGIANNDELRAAFAGTRWAGLFG